jgi:hypothetical protein
MLSPNWHLPHQEHVKGSYTSVYIDGITYVVMSYIDYTTYPYGSNGVISGNVPEGQVTLNIHRIQNLLNSLHIQGEKQNRVIEAIWLQEIYELKQNFSMALDHQHINLL